MTTGEAVELYRDRQDRRAHPEGKFDNHRRWYPSECERQSCCARIRRPSAAYPYSLMTHCRSAEHVSQLAGIPELTPKRIRKAFANK